MSRSSMSVRCKCEVLCECECFCGIIQTEIKPAEFLTLIFIVLSAEKDSGGAERCFGYQGGDRPEVS